MKKILINSVIGGILCVFYNIAGFGFYNFWNLIFGFLTGFILVFLSSYITYKILFKEDKV